MEPSILDNDSVVISTSRKPRHDDIIFVRTKSTHPMYGNVSGAVWRYHFRKGQGYLRKDNPRHAGERLVCPKDILGVVTRVLPREYRDEAENYYHIQTIMILRRECGSDESDDLGYFDDRTTTELRSVVEIPPSELINDRLPWGLFRGIALADHQHVRITTGDTLIIEPTPESCTGRILIDRNKAGETVIGVLQREYAEFPKPGDFFMDLSDRRIAVTRGRHHQLWYTIGVVRNIERRTKRVETSPQAGPRGE
jgi:hypothetical protein